MATIGKDLRMGRLFRKSSGRMLCIAMDHGMMVGAIEGLEDPGPMIDAVCAAGVDAVILNPGMLARYHDRLKGGPAVILRVDQTTMWRHGTETAYPDAHTRQVVSVEDAVQMGADAVITYLFTCNNDPAEETACFEICGRVAQDSRRFGMVHFIEAMAAMGGFTRYDDPETVRFNCRIAGELGADVIKTNWCGRDGFARVTASALAPVAVAGGTRAGDDDAFYGFAQEAMSTGARGLMFGRNVFQRENVRETLETLCRIVHGA